MVTVRDKDYKINEKRKKTKININSLEYPIQKKNRELIKLIESRHY